MGEFMLTLGQSLFNLLVFITFSITGLYLLSRYKKVVDFLIAKKPGIKGQIVVIIVAGILIILASQYAIVVAGARVNVRDCIAIFAGMLAGPLAGISVGLIGGIYRMSLGGWTAIPCGLATIVAGFIGAWLYEPKRRKIMIPVVAIGIGFIGGIYRYSLGMEWSGALICILFVMFAGFLCIKGAKEGYRIKNLTTRQIGVVALITGIWECIHIDIFGPFLGEKAAAEAFSILTTHFLLPMTAINILGIVTFLLVCREATIVREQSTKLKQSHDGLEQKVAERTKELAIANEKLKERYNELKGAEAMLQRDISERKKIEEERKALVKGLEETNLKLAEKAKELEESRRATLNIAEDIEKAKRGAEKAKGELEATNIKLERSNRELQDFTYIASHDLREPMRKISAFGQLLQESLKGKLDEDEEENFAFMIDGATRMQQMIDALLSYSRVTTLAKPAKRMDLNKVIGDLKSVELAVLLEETGGTIHVPEPLPAVPADPSQVHQLLQNLIGNGLKFHREGIAPEITVRSRRVNGNMVQVGVEDNGIGIEEANYEKIFGMFQRLHSREDYGGTGIGLAVCKKIVERHGGSIGVKSTPGKGSTFWFTMPTITNDELRITNDKLGGEKNYK